jgi:hypothetical protein
MVTERTIRHAVQRPIQEDDCDVPGDFWGEFRARGKRHKEDWAVGDFEVWVAPSHDSLIVVRLVGVSFSEQQLQAEFPEIESVKPPPSFQAAMLADALDAYGKNLKAPAVQSGGRRPAPPSTRAVQAWFERQPPEVQALGLRQLLERAKVEHPGVRRKQIEPFVHGRPKGRRPKT